MSRLMVFLIVLGGLLVASLGALYLSLPDDGDGTPVQTSGKALVGGPFELVAQDGTTVTEETFRGDYMLIYFGFTFCPDVCPTELQVMSAALDLLGDDAGKVQPILISIDPERDTVETMADYVRHFHPRLMGLTGTPEQIATAARAYRVYYAKAEDPDSSTGYTMDHSSIVYLMGPEGEFLAHFGPGTSPEKMAAKIREAFEAG